MCPPASGITEQLRSDARKMAQAGEQLAAHSATILATAASTRWQSSAADAMRRRVGDQAATLRHTASAFADAAGDLQRHAAATEETLGRIRAIEKAAESIVDAFGG